MIEQYIDEYTSPETGVLAALNRETYQKVIQPVMLSGHVQGAFLQMISSMIRPKRILEVGTYTGYSAICLGAGLVENGELHTIDNNEELEEMCRRYFSQAGMAGKVTQYIGDAALIIPTISGPFDLVYIDADKVSYSAYYDLIFDKVKVGGYIIADNVLYDGEVVLPATKQSKNGKAISAFNKKIKADKRVRHVLVHVRDGLMMIQKLKK